MLSDEHIEREEITPHRRELNWELFYYEQVGSRSYLRITRLGLALILILTVIPVIALLSIFLLNQSTPMPNVDVTIKPMPAANTSAYPTIHQPAPPPTPKALRQSKAAQPAPPAFPTPIRNGNER